MSTLKRTTTLHASLLVTATACVFVLLSATMALAAPLPNKFLLSNHFGWEVNKTGANVCSVKEECQPGKESSSPGGFSNLVSVAVNGDPASASFEHVYVADRINFRVQEFTAGGGFVSMFGWDVNRTNVEAAAPQAERNVCTAVSKDVCQAGVEGPAPGQFGIFGAVAVDPASGDVYVSDTVFGAVGEESAEAQRVQKFTSAGQFVLEIGKEVNETTKANLCVAGEACRGAALRTFSVAEADTEGGAFSFEFERGNLLTVGGPEDRLYVGDHARVQEFEPAGAFAGEVSLTGISATGKASAVAVDPTGNVFVADSEAPGVHEYNAAGVLQPQAIDGASSGVHSIALDPHGRLGIIETAEGPAHGVLYSTAGVKISEFAPASGEMLSPNGLAFAASGEMYVGETSNEEVEAYTPVVFPETRTCTVSEVTATGAKLCGEINPDGVPATGFFQYGTSPALGSLTPVVFEGAGEVFAPVSSVLTGLVPNQAYQARIAVEAEANGEKVLGHGEEVTFHTPVVATQIPGSPSASFITAQTAVLSATLNPEHTTTHYHFEYGACPTLTGCTTIQSTPAEVSAVYGTIGTSAEIVGLSPATTYTYRLTAINEFEETGQKHEEQTTGPEGTFTTVPASIPRVETTTYTVLDATSTLISGLIEPHGVPTSYAFELGIYKNASTQYGIVYSGSAATSDVPVPVSLTLTGLQPGTTYAYRLTISSGYILNETHTLAGTTTIFTTPGLTTVLETPPILTQLPIPNITIPKTIKPPAKHKKTIHKRHRNSKNRNSKKTPRNSTPHKKSR